MSEHLTRDQKRSALSAFWNSPAQRPSTCHCLSTMRVTRRPARSNATDSSRPAAEGQTPQTPSNPPPVAVDSSPQHQQQILKRNRDRQRQYHANDASRMCMLVEVPPAHLCALANLSKSISESRPKTGSNESAWRWDVPNMQTPHEARGVSLPGKTQVHLLLCSTLSLLCLSHTLCRM